jgi:hypothetical protein
MQILTSSLRSGVHTLERSTFEGVMLTLEQRRVAMHGRSRTIKLGFREVAAAPEATVSRNCKTGYPVYRYPALPHTYISSLHIV